MLKWEQDRSFETGELLNSYTLHDNNRLAGYVFRDLRGAFYSKDRGLRLVGKKQDLEEIKHVVRRKYLMKLTYDEWNETENDYNS